MIHGINESIEGDIEENQYNLILFFLAGNGFLLIREIS